jgi:hypothetical protein
MLMIRHLVITLLLLPLLLPALPAAAQQPAAGPKAKVLVLGLKLTQFVADAYSVQELAFVNDSTGLRDNNASRVIRTYSDEVIAALTGRPDPRYEFVAADSGVVMRVHNRSQYVDWQNAFKEPYTSLTSDSVLDGQLRGVMAGYGADFILSLNFYEIASHYYPMYLTPYLKAEHRIDYEILDRNLGVVSAGRVYLTSRDVRAVSMRPQYAKFAREVADRLEISLTSPDLATARRQLQTLKERRLANAWAGGISMGWGAPYGWFGLELVKNLSRGFDLGGGIGFGPSGFKAGAGVRAYLLNYGQRFNPFVSAHVAWASGLQFDVGGEEDDSGAQLQPNDVSRFKIPAGTALHLKTGFRWLHRSRALLLGVGYGVPFGRYKAEVTGNRSSGRRRTADLFTVGGFEAGFTYLYYFGGTL